MPLNGELPLVHADISLASTKLGHKSSVDLETGLKSLLNGILSIMMLGRRVLGEVMKLKMEMKMNHL